MFKITVRMTASVAPLMKVVGSVRVPPVQAFPDEAFTRVPCVVAHPDDVEYGTSSAVPAWTAKHIKVAYLPADTGRSRHRHNGPKRRQRSCGYVADHKDHTRSASLGGLEPHSTRWLITNGFQNATHGVDISGEPLERGIASLEAHAEYLAAIPGHPAPSAPLLWLT
jgi:hypothetical protein